jgi:predicted AAA+ superfamily ATPase
MHASFGTSIDEYIYFGAYPGAAALVGEQERWRRYIIDSLVETTLSRDVLLLTRVDKPALLRRLFELGCRYSGQVLSYTKMLGQLHDAGNTTTLAHYLDLLSGAGLLMGLPKYSGSIVRQRASSPKLQVLNPALMSALSGLSFKEARSNRDLWGRFVESAVGSHLANEAVATGVRLAYWRDRNHEVDFVLEHGRRLTAIEVKSGRPREMPAGVAAFTARYRPRRTLLVGDGGIAIEKFLAEPITRWLD